jgi:ribosomal protein S18 acetylase RimI-like enzyme
VNAPILSAAGPADTPTVRTLFREYQQALAIDLSFQNFEDELATLPGAYAPPRGCILLANLRAEPAGCVALRPLDHATCEMKRLFVRPAARGAGLGRALVHAVIEHAQARGYQSMRLDTIPSMMGSAVALYRALGFAPIPPYCENPIPGAEFMELRLPTPCHTLNPRAQKNPPTTVDSAPPRSTHWQKPTIDG